MKFVCDRCNKRFSSVDEPMPGRVYRIRCKCGNLIQITAPHADSGTRRQGSSHSRATSHHLDGASSGSAPQPRAPRVGTPAGDAGSPIASPGRTSTSAGVLHPGSARPAGLSPPSFGVGERNSHPTRPSFSAPSFPDPSHTAVPVAKQHATTTGSPRIPLPMPAPSPPTSPAPPSSVRDDWNPFKSLSPPAEPERLGDDPFAAARSRPPLEPPLGNSPPFAKGPPLGSDPLGSGAPLGDGLFGNSTPFAKGASLGSDLFGSGAPVGKGPPFTKGAPLGSDPMSGVGSPFAPSPPVAGSAPRTGAFPPLGETLFPPPSSAPPPSPSMPVPRPGSRQTLHGVPRPSSASLAPAAPPVEEEASVDLSTSEQYPLPPSRKRPLLRALLGGLVGIAMLGAGGAYLRLREGGQLFDDAVPTSSARPTTPPVAAQSPEPPSNAAKEAASTAAETTSDAANEVASTPPAPTSDVANEAAAPAESDRTTEHDAKLGAEEQRRATERGGAEEAAARDALRAEAARRAREDRRAMRERLAEERRAEKERQAEKKRLESERRAEAAKQAAERRAEAKRLAVERRRAEAERRSAAREEAARRAEERRRAEADRKAAEKLQAELREEERRRAEADRKAAERREEEQRRREASAKQAAVSEGLDPADMQAVIRKNRGALDGCVEKALQDSATASYAGRKAYLILLVSPNGKAEAALEDPDLDGSDFGACVRRTASRMSFPAFRGESVGARIPLVLGR